MKERIQETYALINTHIARTSGTVVLSFSHQSEDVVLIDLLLRAHIPFRAFTLDTGMLFEESLHYQKTIEKQFHISIDTFRAPTEEIQKLEEKVGQYGIYDSIDLRKECCRVRKLLPLAAALQGADIWVTGLRADQSITRHNGHESEYDERFLVTKVSPILHWTKHDVETYMRENNILHNPLYDQGYASIGCKPCTRPIKEGESERAGRWWWEDPSHKECGLHAR